MEIFSKKNFEISLAARFERIAILLLALLTFALNIYFPVILFADFNQQINYQGKLTDGDDLAVSDGDWRMYFRLYTVSTGGSNIWEEDRSTAAGDRITITNGLFSAMLGSSTPLTNVNFNQTLYLGVEICGLGSGAEDCDGEMSPRKVLGAVPAAFEAGKLEGLGSAQFLRSDAENATSTASTFLRITQSGAGRIAEFIGQSSASVMSLLSGGNVGVGTSTPYARLSVWGGGSDSTLFNVVSSASTTLFSVLSSGNVGVGTTSPMSKLSVAGNAIVTGSTTIGYHLPWTLNGVTLPYNLALREDSASSLNAIVMERNSSACPSFGCGIFFNRSRGDRSGRTIVQDDDPLGSLTFSGFDGTDYALSAFIQSAVDGTPGTDAMPGRLTFWTSGAGSQALVERLRIDSAGNIGVGTSTPYSRFSIWGSGTGTGRLFELTNNASTTLATFLEDGTGYFLGNIGIGTTTAGTILSLGNTGSDTINISTTATSTFGSGINIRTGCFAVNGTCVGGGGTGASTFLGLTDTQSSFTANRIIHTNSAGNALTDTDGFVFDGINFGVGTTSPYARLSVAGQAVAEYFTATSSNATSTFTNLRFTGNFRTTFSNNRVPFVSTNGILSESADLTYVSGKLTAEGGLEISRNTDTYSHFGGSVANLPVSPTNDTDRLVTIKGVSGTSGERRGLLTAVDFTGSSSNSGSNLAFQSIAKHSGSGALTATTGAGGLSGGRAGLRLGSSTLGTISLATGLSIITERPDFTIFNSSVTELIGLQIESGAYSMGASGSVTDYSGIRVRSPSTGTITNTYGLRIDEITVGSSNRFAIYTGGTTKSYFGGNVGIGTTTPYSKLTVWGSGTSTGKLFELVNNASTTLFSVLDDGTTQIGTATAGNIVFETSATGDIVRVGVGTTTPDADFTIVSNQTVNNTYLFTIATTTGDVINRKFTVDSDGDVAIDGSLTNPADYAEAFTVVGSKTDYEPGDIVVISRNEPGRVEKSNSPYQGNLAGVYSTKPGIIGTLAASPTAYRMEESNDIPVGIMGRVPVKVSLENGPIQVGDYITSSSQSGVGMKADKPGRVVGTALENFDGSEVGKIMVFISPDTFYFGRDQSNFDSRLSVLEAMVSGGINGSGNSILAILEGFGVKIQNGFAYFKNLVAEKFTVGNRENPIGITLFDTITGEPYCLAIDGGVISSSPGECQVFKTGGGGGGIKNSDNIRDDSKIEDDFEGVVSEELIAGVEDNSTGLDDSPDLPETQTPETIQESSNETNTNTGE